MAQHHAARSVMLNLSKGHRMTDGNAPVARSYPDSSGPLLPCPFCGKPPSIEMTGFHLGARTIRCETDDCMGPHTTAQNMDDATLQWNRRSNGIAQAAWKPDLQAARNAVRDEIGSRLCHLTPHGTRICTRQVSSTCLCEETARAALCSQAPSPSMSSTQCGGSDEVQK